MLRFLEAIFNLGNRMDSTINLVANARRNHWSGPLSPFHSSCLTDPMRHCDINQDILGWKCVQFCRNRLAFGLLTMHLNEERKWQ